MARAQTPGAGAGVSEVRTPNPLWSLGLLRSELLITFRRWRTLALLGVLAAVPVLVGIAVKIETSDGSSSLVSILTAMPTRTG
ncbi:hypothetical protein DMH12_33640, partial [Streptomyces sp. WAC 04229]